MFSKFKKPKSGEIKSEEKEFGDIPFTVFYCTVLSRLAYFTSRGFLPSYEHIFGPIITNNLMTALNNTALQNFSNIYNDNIMLKDINNIPTYTLNGIKHLDITTYAKKINMVNSVVVDSISDNIPKYCLDGIEYLNIKSYAKKKNMVNSDKVKDIAIDGPYLNITNIIKELDLVDSLTGKDYTVAYISIATSNYGGYYILVDTRMPNCIFVIFRGTYSAKSASSYSKPESLKPKDGVLKGIYKLLNDVKNTIIQSMLYLQQTYLPQNNNKPESMKVITTGHSLGGGLCTLFAKEWVNLINSEPYNNPPYNVFSKQISCVSIASPRVMNPTLSNDFCEKTKKNIILFKRLTNRGDPVPALPNKGVIGEGYQHPCSTKQYIENQRKEISIDCSSTKKPGSKGLPVPVLENSLKCQNTKTRFTMSADPFAHMVYLYINFSDAVDITSMIGSAFSPILTRNNIEIERNDKKETVARMMIGEAIKTQKNISESFKSVFFVLNDLRDKKSNNPTIVSVDAKATDYNIIFGIIQKVRMQASLIPILEPQLRTQEEKPSLSLYALILQLKMLV